MRRTFVFYALSALAVAGCGSSATFANKPRPPVPVNLSVYINDSRVSVSPTSVGAGPVVFIVTNQARQTESLTIQSPGGGGSLASTGPINPQATAQVTVDFRDQGDYTVGTDSSGSTQAAQTATGSIQAATVHIGPPRQSSSGVLLQP